MPIEIGIWRLGDTSERIDFSAMETESKLEDILADAGVSTNGDVT